MCGTHVTILMKLVLRTVYEISDKATECGVPKLNMESWWR